MKTLEMTNAQLVQAGEAVKELLKESRPVVIGLALRRIFRQVMPALQDHAALEKQIVERHARRDEHGECVTARNGSGEPMPGAVELAEPGRCREELNELYAAKVKLAVEPLTVEECARAGPDAPAWVWLALGDLLEDAPDPQQAPRALALMEGR